MSKLISIKPPDDLRFTPKESLPSWAEEGFIETKCALDVWDHVQKAVVKKHQPGVYLAGPMGAGKSSIMYYVVHKAQQLGWLVVYIPRCDEWVKAGHPSSPAGWYAYFFDAVLSGLKHVPSDIAKKYEYCKPLNHTSWCDALEEKELSLEYFQDIFDDFDEEIKTKRAIQSF